jgi:gas vesicle protein
MKPLMFMLIFILGALPASWAEDTAKEPVPHGERHMNEWPKPIPELLEQLQELSRKIEPEITKLGSKLGEELDKTVKKLREELQSQRRRDSE